MKSIVKDTVAAALNELQGHVDDFKQLANHQKELIKHETESLARLVKALSQKQVEVRSMISKENETNQQIRVAESAKLMTNIEEVRKALEGKLDTVMEKLTSDDNVRRGQDKNLEALEAQVKEHQITLSKVHASTEDSTARIVSMVATLETMRSEAKDPTIMQGTEQWLGNFARQLVASGMTGAMTAVVVMIATRSEAGDSGRWRSSTPDPGAVLPGDDSFASTAQSDHLSEDDDFASTAQSDQPPVVSEFDSYPPSPPNPSTSGIPPQLSLSKSLLPSHICQMIIANYLEECEHNSLILSPSTQTQSEKLRLTSDNLVQQTKTTKNSKPTRTKTSISPSPNQSSQSSKKMKASESLLGSSNDRSYSDDTTYSSRSLQSRRSYSRDDHEYNYSSLLISHLTLSYPDQHRCLIRSNTKSTLNDVPKNWVWICCQCHSAHNVMELMLIECCSCCGHLRDSRCAVGKIGQKAKEDKYGNEGFRSMMTPCLPPPRTLYI